MTTEAKPRKFVATDPKTGKPKSVVIGGAKEKSPETAAAAPAAPQKPAKKEKSGAGLVIGIVGALGVIGAGLAAYFALRRSAPEFHLEEPEAPRLAPVWSIL